MSTAPARMLPEVYTWSFPGSPIEIRMQLSVVHEMGQRLGKLVGEDGKARLEGGLLLGDKPRPGITQVTGFCALTELDNRSVDEALVENEDQVIGFYRSTSAGDLNLSESDSELAKRSFASPGSIVLLIEEVGAVPGRAVFAFWDHDSMMDFPLMEFPFDRYQLAVAEAERQTRQKPPVETPTAIDPPSEAALTAVDPPSAAALPVSSTRALQQVFLVMALVVVGGSAGYFWFHGRPALPVIARKPTPAAASNLPASSLGLAAERRGSDLLLSWNTSLPSVANASFGMLLIRGDGGDRQIALSADQLRAGKVLYALTSQESEIQLNVVDRDKVSRDSVVVVLAQNPADRTISPGKSGSPKGRSAEVHNSEITPSHPSGGHEPPKAFTRPAGTRPVTGLASLAEPPSVAFSPAARAATDTLSSMVPTLPGSGGPQPPRKSSEPRTVTAARGPVPLQQPVPKITEKMKSVLTREMAVQLKLSIDAMGRVSKTEPVGSQGGNPLLVAAAVEAARYWTFQPGTLNNQPVASEMIVTFHFAAAR